MSQTIRLLPFAGATGATNMAADEAMLESAVGGVASLRFYTWTEPTLSLGYFQPAEDRTRDANLSRLAWVRRSTGGAAIVHHHELTYALALPPGKEWASAEHWICRIHHILQRVLKEHGVESHAVVCGEEQKLGPVVCFLHQTPGDLLIEGSKVAGSAQRKMRGALLQHGSILLRRSEFVPHLLGICDRAETANLGGATASDLTPPAPFPEEEGGAKSPTGLCPSLFGAGRVSAASGEGLSSDLTPPAPFPEEEGGARESSVFCPSLFGGGRGSAANGEGSKGNLTPLPFFEPVALANLLTEAFARDTGWSTISGEWTAEERARTQAIRAEKYANPAWNEKR